jgi:hypothetical protein
MTVKQWLQAEQFPLALIAVMVLTRFHHFGDVLHLPDASLAVFFFAGFYRKKALLGFLLALAAIIDYLAIANGTSSYCVSPAYIFLIPTYAVMWMIGRHWAQLRVSNWAQLAQSSAGLVLACSLAFLISNTSFYLFSGRFGELSWLAYSQRVAHYYPLYLGSTVVYGLLAWAGVYLFTALIVHKLHQDTTE